jgi:hypothetical protein
MTGHCTNADQIVRCWRVAFDRWLTEQEGRPSTRLSLGHFGFSAIVRPCGYLRHPVDMLEPCAVLYIRRAFYLWPCKGG